MTSPNAPEPDKFLAARLKTLREERAITQEECAVLAGLTASALSRIERGLNSPGWMTVRALADVLDIAVSDLAHDVEDLEAAAAEGSAA